MLNEKEHVKWAMMRTSKPYMVADALHLAFGIDDIDVFESTINDLNGDVVEEIYVLEFDATEPQVEVLKKAFGLEDVRGYLM